MAVTPSGYFSIDTLAEFLSVGTKEFLGRNISEYGFSGTAAELNPDTNVYFWSSAEVQTHTVAYFWNAPETAGIFQRLQQKGLLDECYALPKLAVTVTGLILGREVIHTNALELTRPDDLANGIATGERPEDERIKRTYLVWCYADGHPYERQIRTFWAPDRDQKLLVLESRRREPRLV